MKRVFAAVLAGACLVPSGKWLEFARRDLQRREGYLIVDRRSNSPRFEKASR
jgi:hypothetical protein